MLSRKHLFLDPGNQLMGGFSFSKSMEVLTTSKGFISETEKVEIFLYLQLILNCYTINVVVCSELHILL